MTTKDDDPLPDARRDEAVNPRDQRARIVARSCLSSIDLVSSEIGIGVVGCQPCPDGRRRIGRCQRRSSRFPCFL
jgi:hypothetical protein